MRTYKKVTIETDGSWKGSYEVDGQRMAFVASPHMLLIRTAFMAGCDFEDLADGFGPGLGTLGGDWSGIRDSSRAAVEEMLVRALNFLEVTL